MIFLEQVFQCTDLVIDFIIDLNFFAILLILILNYLVISLLITNYLFLITKFLYFFHLTIILILIIITQAIIVRFNLFDPIIKLLLSVIIQKYLLIFIYYYNFHYLLKLINPLILSSLQ